MNIQNKEQALKLMAEHLQNAVKAIRKGIRQGVNHGVKKPAGRAQYFDRKTYIILYFLNRLNPNTPAPTTKRIELTGSGA